MMCGLFNIFRCKSASKEERKQEKQEKKKKGKKLLRKSKCARTLTTQALEFPVTGVVYGPLTKRQSETLALRVEAFGNEDSAQENMQNAGGDGRFESEATVVGKWEPPDVWLVERKKPAAAN